MPPGSADWSARFVLDTADPGVGYNRDHGGPQVAVDGSGNAVFAWLRRSATTSPVYGRALPAGGALGAAEMISGDVHAESPRIAMNAAGTAVFAWRNVSQNTAVVLGKVVIDAAGNAVILFGRYDATLRTAAVKARTLSAADDLGPMLHLSAYENVSSLEVAVNADGNGAVVWITAGDAVFAWKRETISGAAFVIEARERFADGTVGVTQTFSREEDFFTTQPPSIAVGADGTAAIVYQDSARNVVGFVGP